MNRQFPVIAWALFAASILAASALAEVPAQSGRRPSAEGLSRDAAPSRAEVHQLEVKVKLAWLADPVTFPYGLGLRNTPGGWEVFGAVPTHGVRKRALEIARQQTGRQVNDAMEFTPYQTMRFPGQVSAADLQHAAEELLRHEFGERSQAFQVRSDGRGQVMVTGVVASPEEKLAVSRCLQQLKHCYCVVNHCTLSGKLDVAQLRLQVTPDGRAYQLTVVAHDPDLGNGESAAVPRKYRSGSAGETDLRPCQAERGGEMETDTPVSASAGKSTYSSALYLEERILAICGQALSRVEVIPEKHGRYSAHLHVCSEEEGEALSAKVVAVPEVASALETLRILVER